ncbi:MAG TPA: helix-turn-helix domain-containing protein [Thermoanaerobaculia bacterium]|jgi:DNA-binding NtrC family response regulator|nr:helix-turn-helix domain-containing protein [Thermoanaerobaculia bacterium]
MERHVTPPELVRVFTGQATGLEAETVVLHLARCRRCLARTAGVVAELLKEGPLARTDDVRNGIVALLEKEQDKTMRRLRARGAWEELKGLPAPLQLDRLQSDPALCTLEMFASVTAEAAGISQEDPHLGEETALVAHGLAAALSTSEPFKNDLQGEAMGNVANCRRLAADWQGSAAAFSTARGHLRQGTGDPLRDARLLSLQASLAADTGRLEKALGLLIRASVLYRGAQDVEAVALVTVQEASALLAAGRHADSIAQSEEALRWLTPGEDRLEMLARNITTESLVFLGRPAEALRSFAATQSLIKRFWGRRTELQVDFLEALLLDSLEHTRVAEKAFRSNIADLMEAELYKDAFLTLVTHLQALVRRGAFVKAARACEEALAMIERAGSACHSQITELWRGLLTAINVRRLTEQQVLAARLYLTRHWNAPARPASLDAVLSVPEPAVEPVSLAESRGEPVSIRPSEPVADLSGGGYEEALERYDHDLIAAGLARCGGRVRETARLLEISRNTLRAKMKHYNLTPGEPMPTPENPHDLSPECLRLVDELLADAEWSGLKRLSKAQRLEQIRTDSSLRTRELFDVMIEDAARTAPGDPRKGEETALLAYALAGLLPRSPHPGETLRDLWSRALVAVADCRRLAGDWPVAGETLAKARGHLDQGARLPAHEARLLSVQASLASDLGQADEALALLAQATALYRREHDTKAVAALAVRKAGALLNADRCEEAVAWAEEALRLLEPVQARLEMEARDLLTEGLLFLGRAHEALLVHMDNEPLYRDLGESLFEPRTSYLESLLLDGLGDTETAEMRARGTVRGLLKEERDKDAFELLLKVLAFHVRRGEPDKAVRACQQAVERIEEAGIDPEAPVRELWRRLLALAETRGLTATHLREARHYLVRSAVARTALPAWAGGPPAPPAEEPAGPDLPLPDRRLLLTEPPDPRVSLAEDGYRGALERYDRQLVAAALAQSKGRLGDAARLLGISVKSLRAKLKRDSLTGEEE